MKRYHTIRLCCHAAALLIEAVGTMFIFLDTVRINAQLHAAGLTSYDGEPPAPYRAWYYHAPVLGFGLLYFGILVAGYVLWLEHKSLGAQQTTSAAQGTASPRDEQSKE